MTQTSEVVETDDIREGMKERQYFRVSDKRMRTWRGYLESNHSA